MGPLLIKWNFAKTLACDPVGPALVRFGTLVQYRQDDIENWLDCNAENLAEAQ